MWQRYMCILLYVKLIWCSAILDLCLIGGGTCVLEVYVHSAICETYVV